MSQIEFRIEPKITTLLSICFKITAMHSVCRCSLPVWRSSWKKVIPVTYFCPAQDSPRVGSCRKTTTFARYHEYVIPTKFHQNHCVFIATGLTTQLYDSTYYNDRPKSVQIVTCNRSFRYVFVLSPDFHFLMVWRFLSSDWVRSLPFLKPKVIRTICEEGASIFYKIEGVNDHNSLRKYWKV